MAFSTAEQWQAETELALRRLRQPDMPAKGAAAVWRQLAKLMLAQNSVRLAIEALLEATSLDACDPEGFFDLGNLLYRAGQHDAAVAAFRQAARLAPENAGVWHNLGNALAQTGDNQGARQALAQAMEIEPDTFDFVRALAIHLLETGDKAAAHAAFLRMTELRPSDGLAHLNLANLSTYRAGDPHIMQMQALSGSPSTLLDDRINLEFALFKAHDRLGDHSRAFAHLEVANRLRRQSTDYDFSHERAAFADIKAFFRPGVLATIGAGGNRDVAPIFIVGMPRSGTTLTEQILSSHSVVTAGGESTALSDLVREFLVRRDGAGLDLEPLQSGPEAAGKMANFYLERLASRQEARMRVTDKMPLNFRWVGIAAALFPKAQFIHCRRDPVETCFSIYSSNFTTGGNRYGYDLSELGTYYREYAALMQHWQNVIGDRIHEVTLADMVSDQEGSTRALLAFCRLEFEPQCMAFEGNANRVRTLSATQVREPIRGGHADRIKPYLPYLDKLRVALGDIV